MNLKDVIDEVNYIKSIKGDDEAAHSYRDNLIQSILKEIINDNPQSKKMAKEVIKIFRNKK